MKKFIKNGKISNEKDIVIDILIDNQKYKIYNPSLEQILEDGWEEYVIPDPVIVEDINQKKRYKKLEIEDYDKSSNVNMFYMNDIPVWLDKATRSGLMLRFTSEKMMSKTNTSLWYNNHMFEIPLYKAFHMLYALENYASECYDNTQKHLAAIDELETIEDVENYDYTLGYPEKLHF